MNGGLLLNASIEKMNKPLRLKCVSKNQKAMKFYENKGWKARVSFSARSRPPPKCVHLSNQMYIVTNRYIFR
ncbi:hypothetical protein HMPREF0083_03001 [Aneurinibacillus aneurinilyticus ATCC 12856]|uniref:N-acetyltransferase domain-containing protein n=1 Tax=Aneurinibacillus aneurinilyticus ATCC 12856 TaxID=649747 RepID=U1YDR7_ANEAE|nr:hypothetical protein HMPREF0083_03001 [Aneurinibacillus aneurinilyticus ATCC 12856]